MWLLCIRDKGLHGLGLHDLGKVPVQPPASNKDFLFSFKTVHVVVSGGLTSQQTRVGEDMGKVEPSYTDGEVKTAPSPWKTVRRVFKILNWAGKKAHRVQVLTRRSNNVRLVSIFRKRGRRELKTLF